MGSWHTVNTTYVRSGKLMEENTSAKYPSIIGP